jgi:hypothetical protein
MLEHSHRNIQYLYHRNKFLHSLLHHHQQNFKLYSSTYYHTPPTQLRRPTHSTKTHLCLSSYLCHSPHLRPPCARTHLHHPCANQLRLAATSTDHNSSLPTCSAFAQCGETWRFIEIHCWDTWAKNQNLVTRIIKISTNWSIKILLARTLQKWSVRNY